MRFLARSFIAAAFLVPRPTQAQAVEVRPGERVRAVVPAIMPERFYATFVRSARDSVWLRDARGLTAGGTYRAPNLALRPSQFVELDVLRGTSRGKGAWRGARIGLILPAILYATADKDSYGVFAAGALGLLLVPAGALIGAIIGVDQWQRMLPAPIPDGPEIP